MKILDFACCVGKEEHLEQTFFTLLNYSPPELLHLLMYIIYVPKLSLHSFSLSSKNNYSNTEMGILGAMAKHLDAIIGYSQNPNILLFMISLFFSMNLNFFLLIQAWCYASFSFVSAHNPFALLYISLLFHGFKT